MTAERGWLAFTAPPSPALRRMLADRRYRLAGQSGVLSIWLAADELLPVTPAGRRGLLIGRRYGSAGVLERVDEPRARGPDVARSIVESGWGGYCLLWRDEGYRLHLLRDPTGAIDLAWWRCSAGLTTGDHLPDIDALNPDDLGIDWPALGRIAGSIDLLGDRLALNGVTAVAPGAWASPSLEDQVSVWSPGAAARQPWDDRPARLVDRVDQAVDALCASHAALMAELSGGLDSAIVASSLAHTGHAARTRFLNYAPDQAEGDETQYARSVAADLNIDLEIRHKPREAWSAAGFARLPHGLRPPLHALDLAYEVDVSRRIVELGVGGLVTGQGGDAVLFAAPDVAVLRDLVRRRGLAGLSLARIGRTARWTRLSAWRTLGAALHETPSVPRDADPHPWLIDIDDLPPAKRGQIARFVNVQIFWGACLRDRTAELIHPLMSQPVAEHCLSIPTDRLTLGARERGLARTAFADRLPRSLIDRHSKGDLSRFYALVVRDSRDMLRNWLADGRLVAEGVLDRDAVLVGLDPDRLILDVTSNRYLIWAVLEAWVRHWEDRVSRLRPAKVTL